MNDLRPRSRGPAKSPSSPRLYSSGDDRVFAPDRRITDIDPDAKASIEGFQPYRQSDPKTDSLHLLEGLSNIDKHRVIHAIAHALQRVTAKTSRGFMQQVEDPGGSGLPTFAIMAEGPDEVYGAVWVTFSVIFSDSEDVTNYKVVSTLREIRARVAEVIDILEPYAV